MQVDKFTSFATIQPKKYKPSSKGYHLYNKKHKIQTIYNFTFQSPHVAWGNKKKGNELLRMDKGAISTSI
jgi:hypothetical protein